MSSGLGGGKGVPLSEFFCDVTVIVASKGFMASDSRATDADAGMSTVKKIFRLPNGDLVGCAGTYVTAIAFVEALKEGVDLTHPDTEFKDISAIRINGRRILFYDGIARPFVVRQRFCATGSGAQAALGAAYALGNWVFDDDLVLRQAAKIAGQIDPGCGGRVVVMEAKR